MSNVDGVGLAKMFNDAKLANKNTKKGDPDHYYPKLLINKAKRASLYIFLPVVGSIITSIIFREIAGQMDWTEVILPVVTFASLLIFLPLTEEWEYKPWQSAARQMERELKE